MRKAVLLLLITIFATFGLAQDLKTFTITPPGEGGFSYVLQKGEEIKDPIAIEGKSAEVAAPEDPNGYKVYLIDGAINLAASADLIQVLKTKKYAPKSDEFKLVAELKVQIGANEGILSSGNLLLKTTPPRTVLLTPSDKNEVTLYFVDQKFDFEFEYPNKDGEKLKTSSQFAYVSANPNLPLIIDVDENFAKAESAADPKSGDASGSNNKSEEKPKADTGQNPFMSFLRLIVGLAVVGGLGYGAYYYYKNNQQIVEKMANQAGLVPSQNPDPTGALPPEPVKKDLQKIDLGSSANAMGGDPITPIATAPIAKNPRLVTASGDIHLVPEGTQTVGRESADLTLAGESSVSRLHANITRSGSQITVSDAGSTNGTYINGTKIASPTVLNPGDTIQFGAVAYRYEE